jgi:hypothetical protein
LGTQSLPKFFTRKVSALSSFGSYSGFWITLVRYVLVAGRNFFFLILRLYYIIFFLFCQTPAFKLDRVAYGPCRGLEGRVSRPGQIFSLFGKKLIRFRARPSSTFVSNGPGLREVGSARPGAARFQRKMGAYGTFLWALGAPGPKMLRKCYKFYKKMTKI